MAKKKIYWAGFENGKVAYASSLRLKMAVFDSKEDAMRNFRSDDIRPVQIIEIKEGNNGKSKN